MLAIVAAVAACGGGDDVAERRASSAPSSAAPSSTSPSSTTAEVPMDPRSQLTARLSTELDDPDGARSVVAAMDDAAVAAAEALADGDIAGSPWLSYRPSTVPVDEIDSLWVFSYGFRFADPAAGPVGLGARVPGPDELVPGPTNEALARAAADVVVDHPVPVVAQWEVARELQKLGVADVISVEPDTAPDGSVVYLSTAGVADKGLRQLTAAGKAPGHAGVLCFRYHAERCVLTARAAGLTADVPEGADLPSKFDPKSGQDWTRSLETWIPVDLAGRTVLKAG